jgi:hypothetical protein
MDATQIGPLCAARGWSRARLIAELRRVGRERNVTLPGDDSLRRMVREWVNGRRGLSDFYAGLFTAVFGVPFTSASSMDEWASGQRSPLKLTARMAS